MGAAPVLGYSRGALSKSLAGQVARVKEVDDGIWLVSFMDYDLGYIELEERTLLLLENRFGPKVLPMSWERTPMSPVRTLKTMVGAQGLEPRTSCV